MKALVTGSTGFVGRHISKELMKRGYEVTGVDVDRPMREGFTNNFYDGELEDFISDYGNRVFDLVVHCAYEVGGRAHIDGKNMALAHNLTLDALLFDWAVRTEQKAVLYFSSCAAYPQGIQDRKTWPFKEDSIDLEWGGSPLDNYGWAKLTGERVAATASELGLRVHTVRPFSGYGADQSEDYPFPAIVRRARDGDLSVWGPPGQTRDWIHISDVVHGALSVYEADYREPVNICTGVGTEMGQLATKVRLIAGQLGLVSEGEVNPYDVTYLEDKPYGAFYRVGDPTLMNTMYTAKISLEEGIAEALSR